MPIGTAGELSKSARTETISTSPSWPSDFESGVLEQVVFEERQ